MNLEKKQIRKKIMELRDQISTEEKKSFDEAIFKSLINSEYYKKARMIFIFVSYLSEVDTKPMIIQALADGKIVCVPKIKSKEEGMELFKINGLKDLQEGFHGILEPKASCEKVNIDFIGNGNTECNNGDLLDLIIMPGVAFNRHGARIGYGGGFYDRFLYKLKRDVKKIAIAYELQVIEDIPMDSHDAKIDGIITERQTTIFNKEI